MMDSFTMNQSEDNEHGSTDQPAARRGQVNHTRLIVTLIVGTLILLGGGLIVSYLLGMYFFDRIDFILSLSVVDLMGCTFYAAWATRNEDTGEQE